MSNVHVVAIQGEVSRLRAEIKQLLAAYLYLVNNNATLEERKQLRSQIKLLITRAKELHYDLSGTIL